MKIMNGPLILTCMLFLVAGCNSEVNSAASADAASGAGDSKAVPPQLVNSNTPSASGDGQAEFSFAGGIEATYSGDAMHMIQETSAGDAFILTVYNYQDELNFTAISIANMTGKAQLGEFALTDESDFKVAFLQNVSGVMSFGGPDSGRLVLGSGDGSTLTGTLNFSGDMMTGTDYENTKPVTVEATFVAREGTMDDLPKGLGAQ